MPLLSLGVIQSESNNLDPDQARHYVGPDLGPNYLEKLSQNVLSAVVVTGSLWVNNCRLRGFSAFL